jgi:hypothetical protein
MKYKNLLNEWKKFIGEAEISPDAMLSAQQDIQKAEQEPPAPPTDQEKKEAAKSTILGDAENTFHDINALAAKLGVDKSALRQDLKLKIDQLIKEELQAFILEKDDRCTRIAKRKYNVWPSAYASGAVVKCRQGKIWKGVSEDMSDEELEIIEEEWSEKYKRSIDCKNPKGFSQRAHCQGKKKNEEVEKLEEAKKPYKPNFSKEKEQGLHGWFARNDGKGWVNCRTGGPCGRDSADSGGKYPACRPTKAQCKSAGKGPLRKKKSSKAISWTKKNKKD